MHIEEGFLPPLHCAVWAALAVAPIVLGLRVVESEARGNPGARIRLGVAAGLVFCLSSIEFPTVAGSEGHATGIGIALALTGPAALAPALLCVLVLQAILLGHGGLTTLGANVVSLAVVAPWCGAAAGRLASCLPALARFRPFLRALAANGGAYALAATTLALAAPRSGGGFSARFGEYAQLVALTQVPLALAESLVTQFVVARLERPEARRLSSMTSGAGGSVAPAEAPDA